MSEPDIDAMVSELMEGLMSFDMKQDLWDWPPILYMVGTPPADQPEKFRVHPIEPIGMDGLRQRHPVDAMKAMLLTVLLGGRQGVEVFFAIEEGEVPVALVLRHEAWGLGEVSGLTPEETEAWSREHDIKDHPDAVEVKLITTLTHTGKALVLAHQRNEPEPKMMDGFDGRVHDVMMQLLTAMRTMVSA